MYKLKKCERKYTDSNVFIVMTAVYFGCVKWIFLVCSSQQVKKGTYKGVA